MASLTELSTPKRSGEQFQLDVPEGWKQGRGAFGGFTIGSLVRAIEAKVGDAARRVRSVTAELPAPVETGSADIVVDILRTGKNLSCARAALVQGGETRAHAVAILAATRAGSGPHAWRDLTAPEVPPWKSLQAMASLPGGPEFASHFEYTVVEGMQPATGPARALGWVRPRVPCALRDSAYIASMCDVWWPAAFTKFGPRACATIAYTLDIVGGLDGLNPDAPLLYRGTVPVCQDGYFLETRELWGEDGRLVAINHQTFAVI
jgi:acyl-CoA thioesterase